MLDTKACRDCGVEKLKEQFTPVLKSKDGMNVYCKSCMTIRSKSYQAKNPDKVAETKALTYAKNAEAQIARAKAWYAENRDRALQTKAEYRRRKREEQGKPPRVLLTPEEKLERRKTKEQRRRAQAAIWRASNKENAQARGRRLILKNRGLTQESFAALLESQGGVCAICELPNSDNRLLCVDHDHICKHPDKRSCKNCNRGLLCVHCNSALHKMDAIPDWHLKAAAYLKRFKEHHGRRRIAGISKGSSQE